MTRNAFLATVTLSCAGGGEDGFGGGLPVGGLVVWFVVGVVCWFVCCCVVGGC